MDTIHKLNRLMMVPATLVCSALITYLYFITDFEAKYNAFVIVLIFGIYEFIAIFLIRQKQLIRTRGMIVSMLCGLLLAVTSLIGVLTKSDQGYLLGTFRGGIKAFAYIFLRTVLIGGLCLYFFNFLEANKEYKKYENKREFKKIWCIISFSWLPYCIMHYPARIGGGVYNQILQFYGQETLARNMSPIIYEGHYISNHHPVLLTYFYGIFFKIGNILENTNSAVFLMSCITLLISSFCMAYMLDTIKKYIAKKIYVITLIIVCFYPIFGVYSYTCCKDNLYADGLLIFYSLILDVIFQDFVPLNDKRFKRKLVGISVLIPFLKNQGLLIVVFSLLLIALYNKNVRRFIIFNIGAVIFIYSVLFSHILMPSLKIAPGGKQEALSVPFQQTALYVKRYGEELTQEELDIINSVLPVDEIATLYEGGRADAVKFRYKQEASLKDLINYFSLWIKLFYKHPDVYFRAFFLLTDGYYYIDYDNAILDLESGISVAGASTPQWVSNFGKLEKNFWIFLIKIPIIGCFFRASIFSWFMIFTAFYCIYAKRYKWLLILCPVILNFAVCLLCPWNGIIRYALPIIYAVPVYVSILSKAEVAVYNDMGDKAGEDTIV